MRDRIGKVRPTDRFVQRQSVHDLLEARQKAEHFDGDIALVRVEEIYPFPSAELGELLSRYERVEQIAWLQEEAKNMGAWSFVQPHIESLLPEQCELRYVGRDEGSNPAGSHQAYE